MSSRDIKVVVCGATGMVGSHLTAELAGSGYSRIAVVVRESSSLVQLERTMERYLGEEAISRVDIHYSNLDDVAQLSSIFEGAELLFNAAAMVDFSVKGGVDLIYTNIIITSSIVEAARRAGVPHIIHTGSIASLERRGDLPTDESHHLSSLKGQSPYAISKFHSDAEIEKAHLLGIKTTIVQPSVILGSGNWSKKHISGLFKMIDGGFSLSFAGVTGYIDVEDVARAMVIIAQEPKAHGERFVLNSANLSYDQLFNKIASSLGVKRRRRMVGGALLRAARRICLLFEGLGIRLAISSVTLKCLYGKHRYDGSKIERYTSFRYRPIDSAIVRIAKEYRAK